MKKTLFLSSNGKKLALPFVQYATKRWAMAALLVACTMHSAELGAQTTPTPATVPYSIHHHTALPEEFADINPLTDHNNPPMKGLDQLKAFPRPRYMPKNDMLPNVALFPTSGDMVPNQVPFSTKNMDNAEIVDFYFELAQNWNYYFPVSLNTKSGLDDLTMRLINKANDYPDFPRYAGTFWQQISPDRDYPTQVINLPAGTTHEIVPNFVNTCLPEVIDPLPKTYDDDPKPNFYYDKQCLDGKTPCFNPKINSNFLANNYYLYKQAGVIEDTILHTTYKNAGHFYRENASIWDNQNYFFREDITMRPYCLNETTEYGNYHKLLSPIAPQYAFMKDAELHHYYLSLLTNASTSGNPSLYPTLSMGNSGNAIDLIMENGEVEYMIPLKGYTVADIYTPPTPSQTSGTYNIPRLKETGLHNLYFNVDEVKQAYLSSPYNVNNDPNLIDEAQMHYFQTQGVLDRYNTYLSHTIRDFTAMNMPNTKYSLYKMDGQRLYSYEWDVMRNATSTMRPATHPNNKHSTPDYYDWFQYWYKGGSGFDGMTRIIESRNKELNPNPVYTNRQPDELFSPFVCAGWNPDENYNKRPGQWLGLLKCLNVMGADFFYACNFGNDGNQFKDLNHKPSLANMNVVAPMPPPTTNTLPLPTYYDADSKYSPNGIPRIYDPTVPNVSQPYRQPFILGNYVWNAAIPIYAQAVASRYQNLLLKGKLMPGDAPSHNTLIVPISYNFIARTYPSSFVHSVSGLPLSQPLADVTTPFVVARQLNNQRVIAATLQPADMVGVPPNQRSVLAVQDLNADVEGDLSIKMPTSFGTKTLKFTARRQGSVYFYDSDPSHTVFYQIDGWHEWKHPLNWCDKQLLLEAEMYDYGGIYRNVRTQKSPTADPTIEDFVDATTFIGFGNSPYLDYSFETAKYPSNNYTTRHLYIRVKGGNGEDPYGTAKFRASIGYDGPPVLSLSSAVVPVASSWQWVYLGSFTAPELTKFFVRLQNPTNSFNTANAGSIVVDKILVTTSSNLPQPQVAYPRCP